MLHSKTPIHVLYYTPVSMLFFQKRANEFWSLLDPRWHELHNRVMYFENAYKTYVTELFYTQTRVQRSTKSISIDYILMIRYLSSNRAWPPGVFAGQVGTEQTKKTMRKVVFFQAGQWAALSSFKVSKKAFSWKMVGFRHKPDINPVIMGKIQTCGHCWTIAGNFQP